MKDNTIIIQKELNGFISGTNDYLGTVFFRFVDRDTLKSVGVITGNGLDEQLRAKGFKVVAMNQEEKKEQQINY